MLTMKLINISRKFFFLFKLQVCNFDNNNKVLLLFVDLVTYYKLGVGHEEDDKEI